METTIHTTRRVIRTPEAQAKHDKYTLWRNSSHGVEVFTTLGEISIDWAEKSRRDNLSIRWSIDGAVEVLRYQARMHGRDINGLKISNDWKPFLARELMDTYPELVGMFRLKAMQGVTELPEEETYEYN